LLVFPTDEVPLLALELLALELLELELLVLELLEERLVCELPALLTATVRLMVLPCGG
jgi:hypothetical protein